MHTEKQILLLQATMVSGFLAAWGRRQTERELRGLEVEWAEGNLLKQSLVALDSEINVLEQMEGN